MHEIDTYAAECGLIGTQLSELEFIGYVPQGCLQRDIKREFAIQRLTATVLLQRMVDCRREKQQASTSDFRQINCKYLR